jgi:hypothetical protein
MIQPAEAPDGKAATIWILRDGTPRPVQVVLGEEDTSDVAVLSGPIDLGTQVVVGEMTNAPSRRLFGIRFGQ